MGDILVFLALFGIGMLELLLVAYVIGTGMQNGPVMFDYLVVLVGCFLLEMLISCRVLRAWWSCNQHFDICHLWMQLVFRLIWTEGPWNGASVGCLAVVCCSMMIFLVLWQSCETGSIWSACRIWCIVCVAFLVIICTKVSERISESWLMSLMNTE